MSEIKLVLLRLELAGYWECFFSRQQFAAAVGRFKNSGEPEIHLVELMPGDKYTSRRDI